MDTVYVCPSCKAIGRSYVSNCPKCGGGMLLEVPFDGKWVMVSDPDLKRYLQEKYELVHGNAREL